MTTITEGPDGRPLSAADVREGDTVILAPNPDDGITHLRHLMGPGDTIGSFWRIVSIERPAEPELPTEPGHYLDQNGRHWLHQIHDGSAYGAPERDTDQWLDPWGEIADPIDHMPFTRLVPAGSEREAARKEVISFLRMLGEADLADSLTKYFALGTGDGQ